MKGFLNFLEQTEFSNWVRDAPTIWAFPTILFVHTLGMGIVAGGSTMISVIVLGFWPRAPQDYSFSFECADKSSGIRKSIRSRSLETQRCWPGLRWPAGLAQLPPAVCWPMSDQDPQPPAARTEKKGPA